MLGVFWRGRGRAVDVQVVSARQRVPRLVQQLSRRQLPRELGRLPAHRAHTRDTAAQQRRGPDQVLPPPHGYFFVRRDLNP